MEFGSLPRYSGGSDDGTPARGHLRDRHTWEFASAALLAAVVIGGAALVAVLALLMLSGVGAFPGLA